MSLLLFPCTDEEDSGCSYDHDKTEMRKIGGREINERGEGRERWSEGR